MHVKHVVDEVDQRPCILVADRVPPLSKYDVHHLDDEQVCLDVACVVRYLLKYIEDSLGDDVVEICGLIRVLKVLTFHLLPHLPLLLLVDYLHLGQYLLSVLQVDDDLLNKWLMTSN